MEVIARGGDCQPEPTSVQEGALPMVIRYGQESVWAAVRSLLVDGCCDSSPAGVQP